MKVAITVTVDDKTLQRISEDTNLDVLGKSGIVQRALVEYYQRKDRQWRQANEKHTEREHR